MKSNRARVLSCVAVAALGLGTQTARAANGDGPLVTSVPDGIDIPCESMSLPFRFAPAKKGFDSTNAFWMMWMAMRAYAAESPATKAEFESLGYHDYTYLDNPETGLHGFVAASDDAVVVSFRGSSQPVDWLVDASFALIDGAPMQLPGHVHEGFALDVNGSWKEIQSAVDAYSKGVKPIWVTGHSLGGALATITAYRLAKLGYPVAPLYTFAAPRSGDETYAQEGYRLLNGQHYRFTNDVDLVPHIPTLSASAGSLKDVFPGPLGDFLSALFEKGVKYANYSQWIRFDAKGQNTALTLDEVADDEAFWKGLGALVDDDGATQAAKDILGRQAGLHSHKNYYCLMQDYYQRQK